MKWQSALAIYFLFWVMSAFVVLPWGVRTHDEAGIARIPGQAESAPADFRPWRVVAWTTLVASVLFGLFFANFVYGWAGADQLSIVTLPKF